VLLVILGAGASYDSDRNRADFLRDKSLPLAQDLFSPRFAGVAARYDAIQGILRELSDAKNVEQALEKLINESERYPHRVRQLLGATYYIRHVVDMAQSSWLSGAPDHVTNYVYLVEEIEKWRVDSKDSVTFVTFNYDTLLEMAIHAVIGKAFRQVDDYITDPMPVFKLHGSIDWWQGVQTGGWSGTFAAVNWADQMIEAATGIQPTGAFIVRNQKEATNGPVIPALSLPILTKGDEAFACPPSHLDPLKALLPTATKVLVIGWRGAEAHFYTLWKDSYRAGQGGPKALAIIDKDEGIIEPMNNLQKSAHWLPRPLTFAGGFSQLMGTDALAAFLAK
jgi:hypothetical protein